MKKNSLVTIMLAAMCLLTACNDEVSMLTVINKDGSAHREVCFVADSSSTQSYLPDSTEASMDAILNDDKWSKQWMKVQKDSSRKDSTLMCFASRDFSDVMEMAKAYPIRAGGKSILKDCNLNKTFRWFYTDYAFSETYNDYSAPFNIPITEYLDKDAASYFLTGIPDLLEGKSGCEAKDILDNMNTQYEHWITANIINDMIEIILDNYDSLPGIPITKEDIAATRDSLINYAIDYGPALDISSLGLDRMMDAYYHTDYFKKTMGSDNVVLKSLEAKLASYIVLSNLDVEYRLAMPGAKITNKGNGVIKDNEIYYSITKPRLLAPNYTIAATFRRTNLWAYIVTLLVASMAIWLSIKLRYKRECNQ